MQRKLIGEIAKHRQLVLDELARVSDERIQYKRGVVAGLDKATILIKGLFEQHIKSEELT